MKQGILLLLACQVLLASLGTAKIFDLNKLLKSLDSKKNSKGHQNEAPIPRQLLDEFSTYVDRLKLTSDELRRKDYSAVSKDMMYDFDKLRKALSEDDIEDRDYVLKPGQVAPLNCGEFGCCPDDSPADSRGKQGCALKLCADVYFDTCNALLELGQLDCEKNWKNCPFSCNKCKLPAAPLTQCESNYPGAFCCWNGQRGTGPDGKRCLACADHYNHLCRLFKGISRGCNSNSWRIRTFMQTHCPATCGRCSR